MGSGGSEPGRRGTARGSGLGLTSPPFGCCGGAQHRAVFSLQGAPAAAKALSSGVSLSPAASGRAALTCFKRNALEQLPGLSLAPLGAGRCPQPLARCSSQILPRVSLKGPVEGLGDFFPIQENSSGIRKITFYFLFFFKHTVFFPRQPPAAQASGSALARAGQLLQAVALLCSLRTGKGLSPLLCRQEKALLAPAATSLLPQCLLLRWASA